MATTTNYGWTTPDDTALVKDGASAIRSLGTSIDTTTKNLNPSTTLGDIEYRSSTSNTNTRLGIGTSGQGLQVVGGVPAWAASSTSTLTTTGDLLYASAANTLARRAIGSTGDVLTVSGGLPTWAAPASGGITQITSTTASTNTVTFSSIAGTYQHLYIIVNNFLPVNNGDLLWMRFNGSSASYVNNATYSTNTDVVTTETQLEVSAATRNTGANGATYIFLPNYAVSTTPKLAVGVSGTASSVSAGRLSFKTANYWWNNTAAITSIAFTSGGGNISSGVFTLYGVK